MVGWEIANCHEMASYIRVSSPGTTMQYRGTIVTPPLNNLTAPATITVNYDVCRFSASGPVTFQVRGAGSITAAVTSFDMTAQTASEAGMSPDWVGVNNTPKYWTRFTVTIANATTLARALGAVDAINLDGGGSTTMYVKGHGVLNYPCDNGAFDHRGERAVASAIHVK